MNVSIIITYDNEERTIKEIIYSVKKNISENDELIVIDDYSTDQTRPEHPPVNLGRSPKPKAPKPSSLPKHETPLKKSTAPSP